MAGVIHNGQYFVAIDFLLPTPTSPLLHCIQIFHHLVLLHISHANATTKHSREHCG